MKKFLDLLKLSLRSEGLSFTDMPLNRAIFLLAVPMILEMFWEALFAISDAFFVSKISVDAVATVGLTESLLTIVYSIAWGLSTGTTALVARRIGEQNPKAAAETTIQAMIVAFSLGLIFGLFGYFNAENLLNLMNASPEVIASGLPFTKLMFLSCPSIMLLFTLSGALRGCGDASRAMWSLGLANVINIVLDYLLIFHFEVGVVGAAIATTIGRTIGVFIQFYLLSKDSGNMTVKLRDLKIIPKTIKDLLAISSGSAGQFIIASASWIFLARIISSYGSDVVAGYTIAIRILIFTILPSWGMANAAATLVGQNLGAKQPEVAEMAAWKTAKYNMYFLICVGIVFFFFSASFIKLFNPNPVVVSTGSLCLKVLAVGYLFWGHGMVLVQCLNGAGDTKTPTFLNILVFWIIEIPLAYVLAKWMDWGPLGVFASIAISESLLAVFAIFIFKRGKWKTIQV